MEQASSTNPRWSLPTRIAFRFFFAFLVLQNFPFQYYTDFYSGAEEWLVKWVALRFAHMTIVIAPTGSGDTSAGYVEFALFLAISILVTIGWSIADRKRANYTRLHRWLCVYVRFALAAAMITYGASKVIKSQFPNPGLDRMLQPIGFMSPMGLLWTMMGFSAVYNVFGGAAEMLGGLLLTTRRTTLAGALVSVAVMANVVALNFSYDVPVKLYSSELLFEALFLAAPDAQRLLNLFVLNRAVPPAEEQPLFRNRYVDRGLALLMAIVVVLYVRQSLHGAAESRRRYGDLAPKPPLYGVWNVEEFVANGVVRPPLVTDATRWRRVIVSSMYNFSIQLMSDERMRVGVMNNPKTHTFVLRRQDPKWQATLNYQQPQIDTLVLDGAIDGQQIHARLHRVPAPPFLLQTRGFHWVTEFPYNR